MKLWFQNLKKCEQKLLQKKIVKNPWNSDFSCRKIPVFILVGQTKKESPAADIPHIKYSIVFFSDFHIENGTWFERKKLNENRCVYRNRNASHVDIENVYNISIFIIQLKIRGENWIFNFERNLQNVMRYCRVSWHAALHAINWQKSQDYKHLEHLYFLMHNKESVRMKTGKKLRHFWAASLFGLNLMGVII